MALEALKQLYRALESKPERITTEECDALDSLAYGIVERALICASFAGGCAWKAARRVKGFDRFAVTGGVASLAFVASVHWTGNKTAMSHIERILGQDATRLQKELMNILTRDNQGEAWGLEVMSKHFFPESIYDDNKADKPQIHWRRRNIFTDAIFPSLDLDEAMLHSSYGDSPSAPNRSAPNYAHVTRTKPKVQRSSGNADGDMDKNPFDCIFGDSETSKDIQTGDNLAGSSRVLSRKQRRAQRRHRIRNQEASLGTLTA